MGSARHHSCGLLPIPRLSRGVDAGARMDGGGWAAAASPQPERSEAHLVVRICKDAVMPGWLRISHVWSNPAKGTPPFVTGMWALAPAGAEEESVVGLLSEIRDVYNDAFDAFQNAALGAGVMVGNYVDEESAFDVTQGTITPAGGGSYGNPGWSLRSVLQGSRPPGGRANSMYWPFVDTTYYSTDGTVGGGAQTLLSAWCSDILDVFEPSVFQWRNRHFMGTPEASSSMVTGISASPTMSFMQRRYR